MASAEPARPSRRQGWRAPAAPPAAGAWPEAPLCRKTARAVMTTAKPNALNIRRVIVVSPARIWVRTLRQLTAGVKAA